MRFFERFHVAFVSWHARSLLPSLFLCCYRACDFKSLPLSQASTNRMENITTKSSTNLEEGRQDNFSNYYGILAIFLTNMYYIYLQVTRVYDTLIYEVSISHHLKVYQMKASRDAGRSIIWGGGTYSYIRVMLN